MKLQKVGANILKINNYLRNMLLYLILIIIIKVFEQIKKLIKNLKNKDLNYINIDNKNNIEIKKEVKNNYKKYVIREFLKENVGL